MRQNIRTVLQDIRHGFKLLRRYPGFTFIAVMVLALGIGANSAFFSVVKTVLLDPLPVRDPDRLVSLVHRNLKNGFSNPASPYNDFRSWQREMRSFQEMAAHSQVSGALTGAEEPARVVIGKVSWNFFPMLGIHPQPGRHISQEEDRPGSGRVALLTYPLFRRVLDGRWPGSGSEILLDGQSYAVIGVLPEGFRFLGPAADLYVPLAAAEGGQGAVTVNVYARLKEGLRREQVQQELDRVSEATVAREPRYRGWRLQTGELRDWVAPDIRMSLWVLLGAVGLILLVACSNIAGLLLSRSLARRQEMAIRSALGASRGRLIAQMMAEGIPLGLIGGTLGYLLARWGVQVLPRIDISRIPRVAEVQLDATMLLFTLGTSLGCCLLFGLAPALTLSRSTSAEALQDSARTVHSGIRGTRLRAVLVSSQIALALTLSIGALLMIGTYYRLSTVQPGFNPDHLLTASLEPLRSKFKSKQQLIVYYQGLLDRVRAIPGVQSAGLTSSLPLGGNYFRGGFLFEGQPSVSPGELPVVNLRTVDDGYFSTLQIPLARGRCFEAQDRENSLPVVMINETVARQFFPGQDPIGKQAGYPQNRMTIIGVARDVRHTDVGQTAETEVLLPFHQAPMLAMTLVVRLDPQRYKDPVDAVPLVRRAAAEIDKNLPLFRISSMDRIMGERLGPRRLNMFLLMMFAALALLLAALGVYGLLAGTVERRTREIGVRMALGARSADVLRLVMRQALVLVAAGLAAGIGTALALARLVRSLLYGVSEADPWAFGGAVLLLALVSMAAGWIPARRALRVDPAVALRWE